MANREDTCGCCEGTEAITPEPTTNRPGLPALAYRVGTHATFLETMKARLSSSDYLSLRGLKTRLQSDPSIAFLDAWATVADVLTFYQERIANEGYLRTATERRSILEMAHLIGYSLRPGLASSVWLAVELDTGYDIKLQPYEIKAQSLPGPGEMPQTFENIEPIEVRHAWNELKPRLNQPQTIETITSGNDLTPAQPRIYVKGVNTNLKKNDVILITVFNQPYQNEIYRVAEVDPDPLRDRTRVTFQTPEKASTAPGAQADLKAIADVADRYASADLMKRYRASAQREMARRVIAHLQRLSKELRTASISTDGADHVIREALAAITEEKNTAADEQYKVMTKWLNAMVGDLTRAAEPFTTEAAGKKPSGFSAAAASSAAGTTIAGDPLVKAIAGLTKPASVPPRNSASLDRDIARIFATRADAGLQVAGTFQTNIQQSLPAVLANVTVAPDSPVRAYAFRAVARPFGHNAPLKSRIEELNSSTGGTSSKTTTIHYDEWTYSDMITYESVDGLTLYLDANYEKVSQDSWIVIDTSGVVQSAGTIIVPAAARLLIGKVGNPTISTSRAAYGMAGPSRSIQIIDASTKAPKAWFTVSPYKDKAAAINHEDSFHLIRQTAVYVQSEELELADEPVETSIGGGGDDPIELDGLYSGLQSGRWLIVAGERDDIQDETGQSVRGVKAAELVMLAEVIQKVKMITMQNGENNPLPGDQTHTFIRLAKKLEYSYRRDTATIYGNVVKATHGETRKETLGSGDAGQAFQSFTLKQPPLTFVASPTPAGADSSLKVFVNDVQWHEKESLAETEPNDRIFVTKTDDDGKTTVVLGNGQHGLRLPTGIENVRAAYRNGIGKVGNARAEQISQLLSKPLGVKRVVNPLRASGGSDRESLDTARKNAPRTVTALDRLVSVTDYADFACSFAGIGKAVAAKITDGRRIWVHLTIAGADDIPIDETSDLYRNLLAALRDYGDPQQPVALQVRELVLAIISARVRIMTDYQWETVAVDVRKKLLSTFSFEVRELGQDVLLSEVIAAIQSVRGVAYVDVDVLGGVPAKKSEAGIRRLLTPKEIAEAAIAFITEPNQPKQRLPVNPADFANGMLPAQLAYLSPDVADTLVINQIK
jgi:hypothetical protein